MRAKGCLRLSGGCWAIWLGVVLGPHIAKPLWVQLLTFLSCPQSASVCRTLTILCPLFRAWTEKISIGLEGVFFELIGLSRLRSIEAPRLLGWPTGCEKYYATQH